MTPAGTRVTWFVLGVCVGVLLAVVGMAGVAEAAPEAASRTAPDTVPAHSGTPHAEGRVKPASGLAARLPVTGRPATKAPTEPLSVAALEETRQASPAEFDLATGSGKLGGGVPLSPSMKTLHVSAMPTAALAGPLISGEATWCAPTRTQCQSWGNGRLLGAVHSFRWGDEPYRVRVSRGSRSIVVTITSFCACLNRSDTIDLSVAAAKAIEPDWRRLGRFAVSIERVAL